LTELNRDFNQQEQSPFFFKVNITQSNTLFYLAFR